MSHSPLARRRQRPGRRYRWARLKINTIYDLPLDGIANDSPSSPLAPLARSQLARPGLEPITWAPAGHGSRNGGVLSIPRTTHQSRFARDSARAAHRPRLPHAPGQCGAARRAGRAAGARCRLTPAFCNYKTTSVKTDPRLEPVWRPVGGTKRHWRRTPD